MRAFVERSKGAHAAARRDHARERRVMRLEPEMAVEAEYDRERDVDDTAVADGNDPAAGMGGDELVEGRGDSDAKRVGRFAAEVLPAAVVHRRELWIARGTQLLHRDIGVGAHVVLDQTLHDLHFETMRAGNGFSGLDRAPLRARQDDVDRFEREPGREPLRLLPAAR